MKIVSGARSHQGPGEGCWWHGHIEDRALDGSTWPALESELWGHMRNPCKTVDILGMVAADLGSHGLWPTPASARQVNMVIGILVFNKLVSKDGITDKKLKERAG